MDRRSLTALRAGKSSTYKSFLDSLSVLLICRGQVVMIVWVRAAQAARVQVVVLPRMDIDNESIKRLKSIWWMPWH